MNAVKRLIENEGITQSPLIMDTKFASIAGMCYDEIAEKLNSYIVIDIGNGHTTAASIENKKIQGIFEHHTRNLTEESLERYIKRLATGEITNEEIYNDHGHGAHVLNPISKTIFPCLLWELIACIFIFSAKKVSVISDNIPMISSQINFIFT